MKGVYRFLQISTFVILAGAVSSIAVASVPARIGPYRLQIYTEPAVIPVGKARVRIHVTDASGKPVEGAEIRTLVQMPSMNMGEKETPAQPVPGQPGSYATEAGFAMAGRFEASLSIRGPLGDASGKVSLETGQDTGGLEDEPSTFSLRSVLPWIVGLAAAFAIVFILLRTRQSGWRITAQPIPRRETIVGVLLILFAFGISRWAINYWRRPGSMTPIEAQRMETSIAPPAGEALVTLAEVTRGPIESAVWYPGQAVAYNEQDVVVRTEGWLRVMPFYVGQYVRENEVVAHLDISDFQEFAELDRMRAELRSKNEALDGSAAELDAARQELVGAEADLSSRQSMIVDAEAMIAGAEADKEFWQQQNARNKTLLDKRAISSEEYQRDFAMAANAVAKAQQAQARLDQARAEMRSAQAKVRKAEAMIAAAEKKRQQMTSDVTAAQAGVRSAEARAGYDASHDAAPGDNSRGHVEIRAHLAGVVTARPIGLGQHVGRGQSILKIAQTDPIRLQANVAEADLARIRPGFQVSIGARNTTETPFIAKVTSVAPTVDPSARTGIVEAVVSNRDMRFRPGQYLEMNISTGKVDDALRVPVAAVRMRAETGAGPLTSGASQYIWVAQESSRAGRYTVTPVEVTTGVSDGKTIQIISGLEAGQKVVTSGSEYLKRGDTVAASGSSEASQ